MSLPRLHAEYEARSLLTSLSLAEKDGSAAASEREAVPAEQKPVKLIKHCYGFMAFYDLNVESKNQQMHQGIDQSPGSSKNDSTVF